MAVHHGLAVAALTLQLCWAVSPMNRFNYQIANPAAGSPESIEYRGEFFEMLGPSTRSQYSEVWWSSQLTPLPDQIVQRFSGKVMAITGYEVDIVRVLPNGSHTSIPCYEQYNHHYTAYLQGAAVKMSSEPSSLRGPHGGPIPNWEPVPQQPSAVPRSTHDGTCAFSGIWINLANGIKVNVTGATGPTGYRCDICQHVYDPAKDGGGLPFDKLPDSWVCPVCGAPKSEYKPISPGVWAHPETFPERFQASCIGSVGWRDGYGTVDPPSTEYPQGNASLAATDDPGLHSTGFFSTSEAASAPSCSKIVWSDGSTWYQEPYLPGAMPTVQVLSEGNGNEHRGSFKGYPAGFAQLIQSPVSLRNSPMIINLNKKLTTDSSPGHVARLLPRRSIAPLNASYSGLLECPCTSRKVKIVDRYLALRSGHCPAVVIDATSVPSAVNTADECLAAVQKLCVGANTTVRRACSSTIPAGCSLAADCDAIFNNMSDSPADCSPSQTCACRDPSSIGGTIAGVPFNRGVCAAAPTSELIATNNGICNISAYEGGLRCCQGGSFLLDSDQQVPEPVDTWQMKYRFYFEEFTQQANLFRVWWSTEATNNEYDVPKSTADCLAPLTDPELCTHQIESRFQGRDILATGSGCMAQPSTHACMDASRVAAKDNGYFQLVYAAAHCHAPSCISLELWDDDTKTLICKNAAVYGQGVDPMDEAGFVVAIPPCIWGEATGLRTPPRIHLDSNLTTIKRSNSTNGHWGVMALWQMRAAYLSP